MAETIARLAGRPLLASSNVGWPLKAGVTPAERDFDMRPEDADALVGQGGPVTLEIQVNGKVLEVRNLWVLEVRPGPNPFIRRVHVADRRWFLPYAIIDRAYNMRRNIGFERVAANDTLELQPVAPKVWYKPWSLEVVDGQTENDKWTAKSMIQDAVLAAQEGERRFVGSVGGVIFTSEVTSGSRELPVESLRLRGQADTELARALKYLPEVSLTVDHAGNFVIFSRVSGKEAILAEMVGTGMETSGHILRVSNELTRPKKIFVHFEMEVEVRFDYIESGGTAVTLTNERRLENVAPVPDWQLTTADGVPGDDAPIVQGTWLDFDRLLAYWGTPPGIGGDKLKVSTIRKAFVPFLDLTGSLRITGSLSPDADWASRISTIETHWRQTYRINPRWVDKSESIRARRVGIVHVTSGTNAAATAYTDYFKLGTQRSFHKNLNADQNLAYGYNVEGYPKGAALPGTGGAKSFTDESKAAPAEVVILDEDQGILRVNFLPDPLKLHTMFLPSKLVKSDGSDFIPSGNPNDGTLPIAFDSVSTPGQVPMLAEDHKLAVIVTMFPASPNDERKLFPVEVKPSDVKELLPAGASVGLGSARGPEMHVRVTGGLEGVRALVRWSDQRSADIDKIFGVQDGDPNLEDLVVNKEKATAGKGKSISLNSAAKAIAARIYAKFADHFEGTASMPLNPDVALDGWVDTITHEVTTRGVGQTEVQMASREVELSLETLLDGPSRELLFKQPQRP